MADQSAKLWHLAKGSQQLGTFSSQQLTDMGKAGQITSDMVVWREGMNKWQPASKWKGLAVTQLPPAQSVATQPAITVAVVPVPTSQAKPLVDHWPRPDMLPRFGAIKCQTSVFSTTGSMTTARFASTPTLR